MSDAERVEVCAVDDLPAGERVMVEVGEREVGVFNIDGDYYAIANDCPHRGGPLCEGDVMPALVAEWSEPGERTEKSLTGDPAITCPWHGWEFDLDGGHHLGDDALRVPTYAVVEEYGTLYVEP